MVSCKFCNGAHLIKNGLVREKQRYRCNGCGKNQVIGDGRVKYGNKEKYLAVAMYLNNAGFRSIGRVLNIPFQIIHGWIKKAGKIIERDVEKMNRSGRDIAILEMDELYTYIQKKIGKYEYGLLLIGTEMKLLRIM